MAMSRVQDMPAVSNSEGWQEDFDLLDEDTDEAFDLTGYSVTLQIRQPPFGQRGALLFEATDTSGEITFPDGRDAGRFVVTVPQATFASARPGVYAVGLVIDNGTDEPIEPFIGRLPIIEGYVE